MKRSSEKRGEQFPLPTTAEVQAESNALDNPQARFPKVRVRLPIFFNMTGRRMYPSTWIGKELALLDRTTSDTATQDLKTVSRAVTVHGELSSALIDNLIRVEVDLSELQPESPSSPEDWSEQEEDRAENLDSIIRTEEDGPLKYYPVSSDHWDSEVAADVDWAQSRITLSKNHLVLPKRVRVGVFGKPGPLIDYSVLPDDDFTVDAYVARPLEVLGKLIHDINSSAQNMGDYLAISESRWGEVAAVIWRVLAIEPPADERGRAKAIASRVAEYFEAQGRSDLVPSKSHLHDAIQQIMRQRDDRDTHSPVLPSFSGHHKRD